VPTRAQAVRTSVATAVPDAVAEAVRATVAGAVPAAVSEAGRVGRRRRGAWAVAEGARAIVLEAARAAVTDAARAAVAEVMPAAVMTQAHSGGRCGRRNADEVRRPDCLSHPAFRRSLTPSRPQGRVFRHQRHLLGSYSPYETVPADLGNPRRSVSAPTRRRYVSACGTSCGEPPSRSATLYIDVERATVGSH